MVEMTRRTALRGPNAAEAPTATSKVMPVTPRAVLFQPPIATGICQEKTSVTMNRHIPPDALDGSSSPSPVSPLSSSCVQNHRNLHERRSKQHTSETLTWKTAPGFGATNLSLRCRDSRRRRSLVLTFFVLEHNPRTPVAVITWCHGQIRLVYLQILIRFCSPSVPKLNSARKPGGPTAMLVAIPNKICCPEGLNDLLELVYLIRIIDAEETKVMGPRRQTPPFVGRWHGAR